MNPNDKLNTIRSFAAKQAQKRYPCPRCGKDNMSDTPSRNALSRAAEIYVCDECGTAEALAIFAAKPMPLSEWDIFKSPDKYDMPETFYFTFGTDEKFPHQNGWVEVKAFNWMSAIDKFRAVYPDRHKNILNCSFFYDSKQWEKMDPPNNWPGYQCYAVIE